MRAAGIAVKMLAPRRPAIRLVVVENSPSLNVEIDESIAADQAPLAEQLHDAAEAIRSRLQGVGVDRVVVRVADRAPVARNSDGPRIRLLTEGAIASAARSVVVDTQLLNGKDAGARYGTNKAALESDAEALAVAAGLDPATYADAIAAALAALT